MKKILLIGLVAVALIVTIFMVTGQLASPGGNEDPLFCDTDKAGRIQIINQFEDVWNEFEKDITVRPILGSTTWQSPDYYQFIGNDRMLTAFEDGHIIIMAIIEYGCADGLIENFSVVQDEINQPYGFPFSDGSDWEEVVNTYGDQEYPIYTYVKFMTTDEGFVEFGEWTEVEENIFVR